ncbi:MAG: hypothetical protein FVQ81_09610 [Candidatus Glassbacteria bacterium]|nr:hypothetical protein [Candidatus Glassbacteria bacterium]
MDDDLLDIPSFLRRESEPGPSKGAARRGKRIAIAKRKPKKAPFRRDVEWLLLLGWSAAQIRRLSRQEARYHAERNNKPSARFGTKISQQRKA